ncbi:MAG: helix-turn-helix domain-containing protein [Lachnospiraceae bacterium]
MIILFLQHPRHLDELCEILYIGRNAAYELLKNNKIKAFRVERVWKIPKKSVEEYIINECGL